MTSASLATQGAKRVPGAQIASTLSDHTAYAEYTMPYRKNRQGSTWAEYYASDSTYYYKSGRLSFVGKWTVEGDNICYFQEDAKGCGPVYDLNGVLYLQSDQPDRYQGKVIAKIVRVEPGDAAHLKDSISPR
ncbi:MAG: hypothetical protein JF625_05535 [Inquilinus limosus]|uniref:Uncharacterized protein n=1 Tax=Inquilinus limosus TaxID=171674 RepID=A0A952FGQ7_9PROT|nr:hypothetical protein [Inquilinus limosus]